MPSCSVHEAYVWMKVATSSKFTCNRCKLPPWIQESLFLLPLESFQVIHAYVRSILWFGDLQPSFHMLPSTLSHWLTCLRKRSLARVKTSKSLMMDPNLNSVVFYYKTTMWSCLSGTTCSHDAAEPTHVLELATAVHPLWISQRPLVDLCCNLSFSRHDVWNILLPTRSKSQADMMVGTFLKNYNIGLSVTR